jgi:hypothetical protein
MANCKSHKLKVKYLVNQYTYGGSDLEAACPNCGRGNRVEGGAGFQRINCACGAPVFVRVGPGSAQDGTLICTVLRFEIEKFAQHLKDSKKKVEVFNTKTGLLYSGCDRAYVFPTGHVDAMPVARAKVYRWIQEYLSAAT